MTKSISVLGSTGSIGRQTLQVAGELGLRVAALTAHTQVELMEEQVRRFCPSLAVMMDEEQRTIKQADLSPVNEEDNFDEDVDLDIIDLD